MKGSAENYNSDFGTLVYLEPHCKIDQTKL